jgi:hypothetical protein
VSDYHGSCGRAANEYCTMPVDGEAVARPADSDVRRGTDDEEQCGKGGASCPGQLLLSSVVSQSSKIRSQNSDRSV